MTRKLEPPAAAVLALAGLALLAAACVETDAEAAALGFCCFAAAFLVAVGRRPMAPPHG